MGEQLGNIPALLTLKENGIAASQRNPDCRAALKPDKNTAGEYPNLAGTFARPIRWNLIEQQYDEMVKAAVALQRGTATAEAILKRYNSYNTSHPTYKALAEVGKAEKTIFRL